MQEHKNSNNIVEKKCKLGILLKTDICFYLMMSAVDYAA